MDVLQLIDEWALIVSEFEEPNPPLQQHGSFCISPAQLRYTQSVVILQLEGYGQGKPMVKQWGHG
jgi:hypothetical protein